MAYTNATRDKLYDLLPAIIRAEDSRAGEPLRALLRIVEAGADVIEGDIAQLAANAFVETAEPWAVPYLGGVIGWTPLDDGGGPQDGTARELFPDLAGSSLAPPAPYRARTDVARTIGYRRAKGTLAMLEALAEAVTGWPAHGVEGFARAGWTQCVRSYLRYAAGGTADLRSPSRTGLAGGPFDPHPLTVDVRWPAAREGRSGLHALTLFVWRLISLPIEQAMPRAAPDAPGWGWQVSPLGQGAPLFGRGRTGAGGEMDLPGPIRPAAFHDDLVAHAALPVPRPAFSGYCGAFAATADEAASPSPSIGLTLDGVDVSADSIRCADLSNWRQPEGDLVLFDVARGRIALGPARIGTPRVSFHEGRVAPMGGGTYSRRGWLLAPDAMGTVYVVGEGETFDGIGEALAAWQDDGRPDATIRITDNRTYADAIAIDVAGAEGTRLAIEAADGIRPHLRLPAPLTVSGSNDAWGLTLSGLLIEGVVEIAGSIRRLRLLHATLVPGGGIAVGGEVTIVGLPSLSVSSEEGANGALAVELAFAITGALRLPQHIDGLVALDSIIDGAGEAAIAGSDGGVGPRLRLERVTVRGDVRVVAVTLASDTIFDGEVDAARTQQGCLRFCHVEPGARTPRRYRCQPDLTMRKADEAGTPGGAALARARVRPVYTDARYGQPGYLQLATACAVEIAAGAENGSEMGAYAQVGGAIRLANLRTRLDEYLPFGLEVGLVAAT